MRNIASGMAWLLALQCPTTALQAQVVPKPQMNLLIVEGEGVINNVSKREPRDLVVQVRDGNRNPLPGATVTFTMPSHGASGEFFDRSRILTVIADDQGRAVAKGLRPNSLPGKVEIHVSATHQGDTARATVTQFNMIVQGEKGGSGKWIALLAVIGAAAAGGVVMATRQGDSNPGSGPVAPPSIGITPGTGTVGPPR